MKGADIDKRRFEERQLLKSVPRELQSMANRPLIAAGNLLFAKLDLLSS